jgi:hypothetical protein
MNWLPEEVVQIIYAFDGRYKRFMESCFSIIDVKRHPRITQDILPDPSDMIPYNILRTIYDNNVVRFGLKRNPILPKNGIEVLDKSWVEKNKALVVDYMAI